MNPLKRNHYVGIGVRRIANEISRGMVIERTAPTDTWEGFSQVLTSTVPVNNLFLNKYLNDI